MIPTIEQIRKLCTESSFERGIEYFRQGSVTGLEQFGNRIIATKELLIPFADSRMGRAHYREIIKYLKQVKRIKGFEEEFRKLVKSLKAKYANRPAFLDEIKSV